MTFTANKFDILLEKLEIFRRALLDGLARAIGRPAALQARKRGILMQKAIERGMLVSTNAAHFIRNIDFSTVLTLNGLVDYQPGQVVSKTLAQNKAVSLTLFAFDKGEEISAHESSGDAMIVVLDGLAQITIGSEKFAVAQGQTIVMPARVPHAVLAAERFKMLLMVVFPPQA